MIENEASGGQTGLTPREVYRVNRIRIARQSGIDPLKVDEWDAQTYYDYLAVEGADGELARLQ